MPKKPALVRLTHVESSQPALTDITGPIYLPFQIKQKESINESRYTVAQIKNALLAVSDQKSGCDFLLKYGTLASTDQEISIGVDQLIGLAKTVALAEKLLHLRDLNQAADYLVECKLQRSITIKPGTAIEQWLKDKQVNHNGSLSLVDPSYWELKKISQQSQKTARKLSPLEKESIEAAKQMQEKAYALNWGKLGLDEPCPQVANQNQLNQAAIEQEAVEVALSADGESCLIYDDRTGHISPLLELARLEMKSGEHRTDFYISGAVTKERAAKIALAHIIERMSASLVHRLDIDGDKFVQRYEASDWWSTIALYFRKRLLGAINPPCLACGNELQNVNATGDSAKLGRQKEYCNGACRKRAWGQRKKAQQT